VFSFLEGLSHGTVLVQALAEEVPAAVPVGPVTTDVISVGPTVAVGDFNGDGKLDVALETPSGPTGPAAEVLLGNGDGSFQANRLFFGAGAAVLSVSWGKMSSMSRRETIR
jgi:FG-GAP repeat